MVGGQRALHARSGQLEHPADVGAGHEVPGWPKDMGAQDPAVRERPLDGRLRGAVPHAQRKRPLRRLELLRLDGAEGRDDRRRAAAHRIGDALVLQPGCGNRGVHG